MGRQAVVQITCDRCTRVEHRPMSDSRPAPKEGSKDHYVFRAVYKGRMIEFEDLCSGCESIVDNHMREIDKSLSKASPIRDKKSSKSGE